jgi:hypothetical protein
MEDMPHMRPLVGNRCKNPRQLIWQAVDFPGDGGKNPA